MRATIDNLTVGRIIAGLVGEVDTLADQLERALVELKKARRRVDELEAESGEPSGDADG